MEKETSPKAGAEKARPQRVKLVNNGNPLRFAHPFFTTTPKSERTPIANVGKGLSEFPSNALLLEAIPAPKRQPPTMQLEEIVGADGKTGIVTNGSITFHAVGDTGSPDTMTEKIS